MNSSSVIGKSVPGIDAGFASPCVLIVDLEIKKALNSVKNAEPRSNS